MVCQILLKFDTPSCFLPVEVKIIENLSNLDEDSKHGLFM